MRQNVSPAVLDAWKRGFSGSNSRQSGDRGRAPRKRNRPGRHELVPVELGHTDTDHTTCSHVPSIGLVVAGDAAYNDVHLYLAESNAQKRQEWIAALDKIESLNPRAVVASCKRPDSDGNPNIVEETPQYIRFRPASRSHEHRSGAVRQDAGALSEPGRSWVGAMEFGARG
jgi:hypothetical protein